MVIQLTAGQMCLLGLMQQKILGTLKLYGELRVAEKEAAPGSLQQRAIVEELNRLREKIKRISARQKRFTSEIINGNGINTIPKESYFKALGLVTKETLSQLNSKSNERRRRTTANPRFSHEAIQAKKALQKPRLEPRPAREKRNVAARNNTSNRASANSNGSCNNNNNNNNNVTRNNNSKNGQQKASNQSREDVSATRASQRNGNGNGNGSRLNATSRQSSNPHETTLSALERADLYEKFKLLQQQLDNKTNTVKEKLHIIKRVEVDNLRILDEMDKAQMGLDDKDEELDYRGIKEALERAARNFSNARLLSQDNSQPQAANDRPKPGLEGLRQKLGEDPSNQGDALLKSIEACFKCEESLDGID